MSGRKTKGLLVGLMALGAVLVMPRGAEGQLGMAAPGCYPGQSTCQFDLFASTGGYPLSLASLEITLGNGWSFMSSEYSGQTTLYEFGKPWEPVNPFGTLLSPNTLYLNFLFELDDLGFAVVDPFGPSLDSFVELSLTDGNTGNPLEADWVAYNLPDDPFDPFAQGTMYSGTVYGPTAVVPEPGTVILMATGLLGVGAIQLRRRRKGETGMEVE